MLRDFAEGKLSLRQIGEAAEAGKAVEARLEAVERALGKKLVWARKSFLSEEDCRGSIENMVGSIQVPLGIAGPLVVRGEHADGAFFVPLATTEGALVASINRGCSAIAKSGGAEAAVIGEGQTRSLVFRVPSLKDALRMKEWVRENFTMLKHAAESTSSHLKLRGIDAFAVGTTLFLRLKAETGDAMGMNMITLAGKKVGEAVERGFGAEFVSESGNMCVDKKPAGMNIVRPRGRSVCARVLIPERVVGEVLKSSPGKIQEVHYRKVMLGGAASATLGFNAHAANVLAALFLATGQDLAHVVEGSLCITSVEKAGSGLECSVTIPSLQVGTVGGGTLLPSQKECLSILGVDGPGEVPGANARKLAEIAAAAVLAGEISLLSALSRKELSSSHERLGRRKHGK